MRKPSVTTPRLRPQSRPSTSEFNSTPFDPSGLGFIGGSQIYAGGPGGRPIDQMMLPPDVPHWGAGWKAGIRKHYRHSAPLGTLGTVMSYRDRYLSLDPTYKDAHGLPLLRITFDWHDNEYKMAAYSASKMEEIVRGIKPPNPYSPSLPPTLTSAPP